MTVIKRSALVSYTPRQMYELVNGVEEYPRFMPWCSSTSIIKKTDETLEAAVEISWKGIHKTFTTRNILHPYHHMEIQLVEGPFRNLEGRWTFTALGDHACKVSLDLEIEFSGGLVDKLFQPVFNHIANSLVEAFCKRAVEIYGQR